MTLPTIPAFGLGTFRLKDQVVVDSVSNALTQTETTPALRPFVGRTFRIDYDEAMTVLNIYAEDGRTMRYEVLTGAFAGASAEVQYEAVEIDLGLYALSWQEADKGTVVHVDDFSGGTSRSFYTTAAHDFVRMAGTLTRVQAA